MYLIRKLYSLNSCGRFVSVLGIPNFTRIIADSDFDGLCGAAILKKYNPDAEIIFSHAALIRNGSMDDVMNKDTVIIDLPFHQNCGWYLDHHQTNKPSKEELVKFEKNGGLIDWQPTPSAARLAYERIKDHADLTNFVEIMPFVDALDSGGITLQEFLADGDLMRFSRTLFLTESDYMLDIVEMLSKGLSMAEILDSPNVKDRIENEKDKRKLLESFVANNTEIIDRLAVCHLENSGYTSNGYLVTAWAGERADACCIIHGYSDGKLDFSDRPPLSASFYANSFIEGGQGRYDLSKLATRFDPNGGGHMNACGCRIQEPGLESNLSHWLEMWANRNELLATSKD